MFIRKVGFIICMSLLLLTMAHLLGFGTIENATALSSHAQTWPKTIAYGLLFLWCFLLFLTVAPLGSFTILAAGYLLGPNAGFVQFSALCLSSYVLHIWTHPKQGRATYQRVIENPSALKVIEIFRGYPISTVCALRIIPVIPSCVCVLTCSAFAIPGRALFTGTLLTGWIRPIALAYLGSQAVTLLELIK